MYCIKCGVALSDAQQQCPLCGTTVFHPEIPLPDAPPLYPKNPVPPQAVHPWGILLIVSMLFLLPACICFVCDLQINSSIEWSGYVIGGLLAAYIIAVLPNWFPHPNPVIFVPVGFAAICLYLLYINLATGGHWFLSFAFPVTGSLCIVVTAIVTLLRYVRRGKLYIYAGACFALAGFAILLEFLLRITFYLPNLKIWSPYPAIPFCLIGITLLLIAICRPLRESLSKKFFL